MKIVRVDTSVDDIVYGAVEPEGIRLYRGTPFVAWEPTETVVAWNEAKLLAPVIPTKIVGVGRNYADHADEMGGTIPESPVLFLKPTTAGHCSRSGYRSRAMRSITRRNSPSSSAG
jgi:2-keto-4-pentenoate hydratase/2-oxohepta-3-ene-1,7-dioic acid hydratase in catechol pathway